jgi:hypothetical protein
MRAALAQIRDDERIGLAVGTDEMALLRGADQIVERKVNLPVRWLKGFVEVQAFQSRMERRVHLGKIETLRFLRSLPRTTMAKTQYWIVPAGNGLRISQRAGEGSFRVAGIERLRLLEDLAPSANGLTVYAIPAGTPVNGSSISDRLISTSPSARRCGAASPGKDKRCQISPPGNGTVCSIWRRAC